MNWISYSFLGALMLAIHILCMTKLSKFPISTHVINAIVFGCAALFLVCGALVSKKSFSVPQASIPWLIIATLSITVVIVVTLEAVKRAPNPGYVTAIQNLNTVMVTLLSVLFLASPITALKGIGIVIALTGITLICLF